MGKSMGKESIIGLMGLSIQEIGTLMKCMDRESSSGQMVESTEASSSWE